MPNRLADLITLQAISPRLAISTFESGVMAAGAAFAELKEAYPVER